MSRMLVRMYEAVESAVAEEKKSLDAALAAMPGLPPALVEVLKSTVLDEQLDGHHRVSNMVCVCWQTCYQ